MNGLVVSLFLLVVLAAGGILQERRHRKRLASIPVRVHVNGTRGKSSMTRLIAAGLRAGGMRTIAKTTGTMPRFIYHDGTEVPVARAGKANVIEQVRIVRRASELQAQVLVTECMAVNPELQSLLEDRMIRSTHSVITNARADHLDEMGPTVHDVARNLGRTISRKGAFFTAEREHLDLFKEIAATRETTVEVSDADSVDAQMLSGFSYFEHAENVALALRVCAHFGIDHQTALRGMQECRPDPGALRIFNLEVFGRHIRFVNAFAMNDPDSYRLVWERLTPWFLPGTRKIIIANCRKDRIQRAEQLAELMIRDLQADVYLISGESTAPVYHKMRRMGIPASKVENLGGLPASDVFERVLAHAEHAPVGVYGIGNIVGLGEEIVEYFKSRGEEIAYRSTA